MARRNDHSREELQQLALTATTAIIAEEGLAGVRLRKVAQAIGYSVGSLYSVFANGDDLILQVNSLTLKRLEAYLRAISLQNSPLESIQALTQAYWQFAQQNRLLWLAIFEHRPTFCTVPAWHQQQISQLFAILEAPLMQLIPPDQVAAAARVLWSSVQGVCFLAMTDKLTVIQAPTTEYLLTYLVQTFLAGLPRINNNTE